MIEQREAKKELTYAELQDKIKIIEDDLKNLCGIKTENPEDDKYKDILELYLLDFKSMLLKIVMIMIQIQKKKHYFHNLGNLLKIMRLVIKIMLLIKLKEMMRLSEQILN